MTVFGMLQVMIDVIVNQGFFRVVNRLFDRRELLRQFETRTPRFEHLDGHAQMTRDALESRNYRGVGVV